MEKTLDLSEHVAEFLEVKERYKSLQLERKKSNLMFSFCALHHQSAVCAFGSLQQNIIIIVLFTYLFLKHKYKFHKYKFRNASLQIKVIVLNKNMFSGGL